MKLFKGSMLVVALLFGFSNQAYAMWCHNFLNGQLCLGQNGDLYYCRSNGDGSSHCLNNFGVNAGSDNSSVDTEMSEELKRVLSETSTQQSENVQVLKLTDPAGKTYTDKEAQEKFNQLMGVRVWDENNQDGTCTPKK